MLASNATAEPDGYAGCGLTLGSLAVWNVAERRLGVPWPVLSLAAAARLWREVRGADAVLLHDSLFMTSIVTFLAAKASGTPLAVIQHIGVVPYRNPILRGLMGLAKPVLFGFIIASIGCFYGMTTRGGTQGVGRSTTQAVVVSSVLIIFVDFLISQFMINVFGF